MMLSNPAEGTLHTLVYGVYLLVLFQVNTASYKEWEQGMVWIQSALLPSGGQKRDGC